jgi:hypothetical protein
LETDWQTLKTDASKTSVPPSFLLFYKAVVHTTFSHTFCFLGKNKYFNKYLYLFRQQCTTECVHSGGECMHLCKCEQHQGVHNEVGDLVCCTLLVVNEGLDEQADQLAQIELRQVGWQEEVGDAMARQEQLQLSPCALAVVDTGVVNNEKVSILELASPHMGGCKEGLTIFWCQYLAVIALNAEAAAVSPTARAQAPMEQHSSHQYLLVAQKWMWQ